MIDEARSCTISAPGGCTTKWFEKLGYLTIPTLSATAFALILVVLGLAASRPQHSPDAGAR